VRGAARLAIGSALAWSLAGAAIAAPAVVAPPPLVDSLSGQAKEDYKTALLLYEDHDYVGALVKFRNAHEQSDDPRLLWNMAACEKNLRRYVHVLQIVERYQRETAGKLTVERRQETEALVRTVRSLVSTIRLTVNQPEAAVSVDGEPVGVTPLAEPLLVDLGTRRLRVSKQGFRDQVISQDFAGGSETSIVLTLQPLPREGRLTVDTGGPGTISLDGRVVGQGRWDGTVPPGTHSVRVTAPNMQPRVTDVVIGGGESRALYPTLEPEKSTSGRLLLWVAGGLVVAGGLGAGGYFLFRPAHEASPTLGTLSPGMVPLPLLRH
jgi:hypothetical protein